MNQLDLDYFNSIEKRLAELEAKEKLFSHKTINERLDDLEQVVWKVFRKTPPQPGRSRIVSF